LRFAPLAVGQIDRNRRLAHRQSSPLTLAENRIYLPIRTLVGRAGSPSNDLGRHAEQRRAGRTGSVNDRVDANKASIPDDDVSIGASAPSKYHVVPNCEAAGALARFKERRQTQCVLMKQNAAISYCYILCN